MAVDPAELSERVTDLEIKLAYQDRVVGALDDVIRSLALRVETLERDLAELRAGAKSPPPPIGPAGEKPPHY